MYDYDYIQGPTFWSYWPFYQIQLGYPSWEIYLFKTYLSGLTTFTLIVIVNLGLTLTHIPTKRERLQNLLFWGLWQSQMIILVTHGYYQYTSLPNGFSYRDHWHNQISRLSLTNNNHNPNNKTTITVVGLRQSNRWEYHQPPPTTNTTTHHSPPITQTQNYMIQHK